MDCTALWRWFNNADRVCLARCNAGLCVASRCIAGGICVTTGRICGAQCRAINGFDVVSGGTTDGIGGASRNAGWCRYGSTNSVLAGEPRSSWDVWRVVACRVAANCRFCWTADGRSWWCCWAAGCNGGIAGCCTVSWGVRGGTRGHRWCSYGCRWFCGWHRWCVARCRSCWFGCYLGCWWSRWRPCGRCKCAERAGLVLGVAAGWVWFGFWLAGCAATGGNLGAGEL